jgi:hypothetical protein
MQNGRPGHCYILWIGIHKHPGSTIYSFSHFKQKFRLGLAGMMPRHSTLDSICSVELGPMQKFVALELWSHWYEKAEIAIAETACWKRAI